MYFLNEFVIKNLPISWMSWLTPIISVLGRLRQKGYQGKLGCTAGTTIVWVTVKDPVLKEKRRNNEQNPLSQKQTHIKMGSLNPFKPARKKHQPYYTILFQKTPPPKKKKEKRKKMVPNSFHEVTQSSQKNLTDSARQCPHTKGTELTSNMSNSNPTTKELMHQNQCALSQKYI